MARDLEAITLDYWRVSSAVRHPTAPDMTCGEALETLLTSNTLRSTDWRLSRLMHDVRYDIIEGNREWREQRLAAGSISTLPTRD